MQLFFVRSYRSSCLVALTVALGMVGCRPSPEASNSTTVVRQDEPKGAKPVGSGTSVPKSANTKPSLAGKPKPVATMSATQVLGVDVLKTLNADPGMKGHQISVGTGPGKVWLDGFVPKAAQRALAEKVARRVAPKAQIINQLKVGVMKPSAVSGASATPKKKEEKE